MDTPFGSIYESDAILKYIARLRPDTGLLGSTFFQQAQVDQWLNWSGFELEVARGAWIYPLFGVGEANADVLRLAKEKITKYLQILNEHLANKTHVVGNQVTAADIVIATAFLDLVKMVLVPAVLNKYGNFTRWFNTCINQPQFKTVIGDVKFTETETQAKGGAAAAPADKGDSKGAEKKNEKPKKPEGEKPKKEEKPKGADKPKKEEKPKKDEKPKKEEKPVEVKAPSNDDLVDEDGKPIEGKKKPNPLDALPKSSMILDAVKKNFFQKKPYYPNFFPELWRNEANPIVQWDAAGYSIYTCSYKYNKDLGPMFFLAGNLIGGFLQRVDELRKYGMGALMLVGETEDRPPWQVWGIWIFRGQDIPAEMKDCDDSEHYDWTKLDTNDAPTRKLIEEYFTADVVKGQTVLDRRYFK
jgi:elongation factor 1-gamma